MYRLVVRTPESHHVSEIHLSPSVTLGAWNQNGRSILIRRFPHWSNFLRSEASDEILPTLSQVAPGVYVTDLFPGPSPSTYDDLLTRLGIHADEDEPAREVVDAQPVIDEDEKVGPMKDVPKGWDSVPT